MSFTLATIDTASGPHAAVVVGDRVLDIAAATGDQRDASMLHILATWAEALPRLEALAAKADSGMPLSQAKLLAPILNPGAIFCAGSNYADHAAEMAARSGQPAPPDPHTLGLRSWHFIKTMHCITGPGATVVMQPRSKKIDWEIELALIIGKTARNVSEADALDYVAGYMVSNDLSARDLGHREGLPATSSFKTDWIAHKNWDGACPIGPWITLARDIPDPHNLAMVLEVNGVVKQDSNTKHMIFNINEQIADLSRNFTLHPGDIILTGTPAGVGAGRGEFLQKGDVVKLRIDGLGELTNIMA